MVPLFGGVPGGPELVILLLMLLLLFGGTAVLVILLGFGGLRLLGGATDGPDRIVEDRVTELERELAETRAELAELRDTSGTDARAEAETETTSSNAGDDYDESRSS